MRKELAFKTETQTVPDHQEARYSVVPPFSLRSRLTVSCPLCRERVRAQARRVRDPRRLARSVSLSACLSQKTCFPRARARARARDVFFWEKLRRHFASSEFAARVRRRLEAEAATVAAEREPRAGPRLGRLGKLRHVFPRRETGTRSALRAPAPSSSSPVTWTRTISTPSTSRRRRQPTGTRFAIPLVLESG